MRHQQAKSLQWPLKPEFHVLDIKPNSKYMYSRLEVFDQNLGRYQYLMSIDLGCCVFCVAP